MRKKMGLGGFAPLFDIASNLLLDGTMQAVTGMVKSIKEPEPESRMTKMNTGMVMAKGGIVDPSMYMQQMMYGSYGMGGQVPVEVEGGEQFEMPNGQQGQFQGPSHEQGGVPTELPQGTKVYSDRLKGENGKTMADRKEIRERNVAKLERLISKNPHDKLLKETLKRQQQVANSEEQGDMAMQEQANQQQQMQEQQMMQQQMMGQMMQNPEMMMALGGYVQKLNNGTPPEGLGKMYTGYGSWPSYTYKKQEAGVDGTPLIKPSWSYFNPAGKEKDWINIDPTHSAYKQLENMGASEDANKYFLADSKRSAFSMMGGPHQNVGLTGEPITMGSTAPDANYSGYKFPQISNPVPKISDVEKLNRGLITGGNYNVSEIPNDYASSYIEPQPELPLDKIAGPQFKKALGLRNRLADFSLEAPEYKIEDVNEKHISGMPTEISQNVFDKGLVNKDGVSGAGTVFNKDGTITTPPNTQEPVPTDIGGGKKSNALQKIKNMLSGIGGNKGSKGEQKGGVNSSGDLTRGDIMGMAGTFLGGTAPMMNTMVNRMMTPNELNHYREFGAEGLKAMQEAQGLATINRDKQLADIKLREEAGRQRGRNSARGVNTLRAEGIASDMGANQAQNQAYAQFAGQQLGLLGQKAQQANLIDSTKMAGEEKKVENTQKNLDNYYSQLGTDFTTQSEALQNQGKNLNQEHYNQMVLNILPMLSRYGIGIKGDGKGGWEQYDVNPVKPEVAEVVQKPEEIKTIPTPKKALGGVVKKSNNKFTNKFNHIMNRK